jgi:hypothetical protein
MSNPKFDELFIRVAGNWPETIDASKIRRGPGDRYSINELGDIWDEVDALYIKTDDEVLTLELCHSLYAVLHKAADMCVVLRPMELRRDFVREIFERRLRESMSRWSTLNWTKADMEVAEAYFQEK